MTMDELEGRLSAQREVLISLVADLLSGRSDNLAALVRDETVLLNGQEDPGALPSEAFAFEQARISEIRDIVSAARKRAEAPAQ